MSGEDLIVGNGKAEDNDFVKYGLTENSRDALENTTPATNGENRA